jgi:hypothetical protein
VAKVPSVRTSGSVVPAGALARLRIVVRSFGGSVTPTGALRRTPGKTLSGSMTPLGQLRRSVAMHLAGLLVPSGEVDLYNLAVKPMGVLGSVNRLRSRVTGKSAPTGDTVAGTTSANGPTGSRP